MTLIAEETRGLFDKAVQPGRFLVEDFPWLRFVPEWFPGTGWKKTAREWRQIIDQRFNSGYEWTLEQIVRILEDTGLVFIFFVPPETGQGHPFLPF